MFEFLFKYPESTWNHAEFVWASAWPLIGLALALVFALLFILVSLYRQKLSVGRRSVVALLQILAVSIVLTMLWRPALKIELMQSGENTVAYLLDMSNSMNSTDDNGQSRLSAAREVLNNPSLLESGLFDSSVYGMANSLTLLNQPLPDQTALQTAIAASGESNTINIERSAIADNISTVLESVNDQALAAVVVLSDGADNASDLSSSWWQSIKAAGVPVHTVGFGAEFIESDIELSDVLIDSHVSENALVTARIRLTHHGVNAARIRVEAGSSLLHAENIEFDSGRSETVHTVQFNSGEAGLRELLFSVSAVDAISEKNEVNNKQSRMLNVSGKSRRVLYVEGEPRWEYKFIRRALHNFNGVDVVSLLRTSPNKFYRQGVESPQELVDGFPKTREQLFTYDAIVIGSLEAAELSAEQQANLRDFVAMRGGSLLMIAGNDGLGDGGWGRSAAAAALPVKLATRANVQDYQRDRATISPTTQGARAPFLQLENDDTENLQSWSSLPDVADIQDIGEPKPGSTVLLSAQSNAGTRPVLVWHRYGQGQSFVFGTSGTWRWQMGLPSDNQWHERFWQQLLGHLAAGSVPQLSFDNTEPVYRDVNDIPIEVTARQANYEPLAGGEFNITVTTPSGRNVATTLTADVDQPGKFIGSVSATEDGPYALSMTAPVTGEAQAGTAGSEVTHWLVKESGTAEQFEMQLHKDFLQRVSQVTGGQYLDASQQQDLVDVLTAKNAGITREEFLPLWNMPVLFLLLALFKAIEWFLRLRWKRL